MLGDFVMDDMQGELNSAFTYLRKMDEFSLFSPFKILIFGLNSAFLYFINIGLYTGISIYYIAWHCNNFSINKYIGINILIKYYI